MKLNQIYELAVKTGIDNDPRSKKDIKAALSKKREAYKKLDKAEKALFDEERLNNPYSDTRILTGEPGAEIKTILAGIDMEGGEVVLADRLRERGVPIDLIMAHHPEGKALAALHDVMGLQADIWGDSGVPLNIGDALIDSRAREVQRALSPVNHDRAVDAARLLDFSMMCVHTPCDNLVSKFLQKMLDDDPPLFLDDVVKALKTVPEYQAGARINAGPRIIVGHGGHRAGRVLVSMTGGTGGPEDSIPKLAAAGVGTLVEMHMDEKLRKKAEEHHVNVVIAGHIASDNIGMNLWLDILEKRGISVHACSGIVRVKRNS